jgi:transposase
MQRISPSIIQGHPKIIRQEGACAERDYLHQSQWLALVRRASGIGHAQDALQPLEAVGRQGHLRPDDGRAGLRSGRSEDGDDRRDLSEGAPHGDQPAVEKGGPGDQRGRLIGRTKGGMNTKLHAVTDADGRPIRLFMTAGQVSDYTGAAALLGSLPKAEWLLADRGYDADWFRDALKDKGIRPCIPGRKSRGNPIKHDKRRYKRRNRIEIMFGRLKDWRRVATRYDRCPKVFLSAVALAAVVMFWL